MNRRQSWRGLYLITALGGGLLLADALAPLSQEAHDIFTVGTILLVCGLALAWTERNADLMERSGIDAMAAHDQLYQARFVSEEINVVLHRPADRLLQGREQQESENMVQYMQDTIMKV